MPRVAAARPAVIRRSFVPSTALASPGYNGQPAVYLYVAALEVNVLNCREETVGLTGSKSVVSSHGSLADCKPRAGAGDHRVAVFPAGPPQSSG
jgi:hypothetical protein